MNVIGVSGQLRNGKDTVADHLFQKLDPNFGWKRTAFASNVKRIFCETFGVDLAFIEEWKVKDSIPPGFGMNVRRGLQQIGDGFRQIYPTIWLDLVFRESGPKIISDVRYINEVKKVKEEGGLNILVVRPGYVNDDPNGSEAQIKPYTRWGLYYTDWLASKIVTVETPDDDKVVLRADHRQTTVDRRSYYIPEFMHLFDMVIRNDGTLDDLYRIIDDRVLPFVESKL